MMGEQIHKMKVISFTCHQKITIPQYSRTNCHIEGLLIGMVMLSNNNIEPHPIEGKRPGAKEDHVKQLLRPRIDKCETSMTEPPPVVMDQFEEGSERQVFLGENLVVVEKQH